MCGIEDYLDPEISSLVRRVSGSAGRYRDTSSDHRNWLAAMAVRGLLAEAMPMDAAVMAVGSGLEPVLAVLAERIGEVTAGDWIDVDWSSYPNDAFDIIVCGPIEGVGDLPTVAKHAVALARVLRPDGVLSLSTRFRLEGPPGGIGWAGEAMVMSAAELRRYLVDPSGLTLVGELQDQVSHPTMSARRDLRHAASDRSVVAELNDLAGPVVAAGGYVFTMAHLLMRKTKGWTPPSPVAASVPGPAARASGGARNPVGTGWGEQVVALQQRLVATDGVFEELAHAVDLLSEADYQIGRSLTELTRGRNAPQARLSEVAGSLFVGETAAPVGRLGEQGGGPTCCRVRIAEGLEFDVVVDGGSADPITTTFLAGYCLFQDLVSLMLQLVSPGDSVLDMGAHVGTFTLAAGAAGCPVLAIEASPLNVVLLRASVARNAFHDVRVVSAAASDAPASVQFSAIGPWGTVLNRSPSASSIEVPAVTIDELLFEVGFRNPRFVKMDVEGSEIKAMHGMTHLLSANDAPALLLESNGHTLNLMGTSPAELLKQVEGFGYQAYMVDGRRLRPVSSADLQPRTEVDYLALKQWPESLTGWQEGPTLTADERVAMLVEECGSPSEDCRAYIGKAIAAADGALLERPDLRTALDLLVDDPVVTVRAAVAWWREGMNA